MLNPNEAPEGCYAVEFDTEGCAGCCFAGMRCPTFACDVGGRQDKTSVIFKRKPEVKSPMEPTMEPELVNMQDKYKYANGEEARIVMVDGRLSGKPVLSEDSEGRLYWHDKYGSNTFSSRNLVKVKPYSEFKRGDKVIAIADGASTRRFFSHVENGVPYCFSDGKDEWTSEGNTSPWESIRRPTPEELGE